MQNGAAFAAPFFADNTFWIELRALERCGFLRITLFGHLFPINAKKWAEKRYRRGKITDNPKKIAKIVRKIKKTGWPENPDTETSQFLKRCNILRTSP